ncbi:MAG TPA: PPOX class F420-dependent oxidoreductase [Steroidobacteraceae bacterium]|nr:PPOX class F420-dependent oxidoreductase [Steroidobacteraceae bacterium]
MAAQLNDAAIKLLAQPFICNLATLLADGSPQITPVWVDYDGRNILINTSEGRQKTKDVERDPRIALDVLDPQNPYAVLSLRGRVVAREHEGADAHIDKLAKKYLGKDQYPFRQAGEQRVILRIEPERILMQPT